MAMFRRALGKIADSEDSQPPPGGNPAQSNLTSARGSVSGESQASNPSLVGLFASRRLLRKLQSRIQSKNSTSLVQVQKEPSYRMEPKRKFSHKRVYDKIKEIVDERLDGQKYSDKISKTVCKVLSDEIKEKTKLFYFDRYKIVAVVTLGEMNGQSMQAASRCAWDQDKDNFVTYNFQNQSLFCTATVYGIYHD